MRAIYLLIVIIVYSLSVSGQTKFPKKEVVEDLHYLKVSLEEAHYNLFAYVTKKAFNENFEKVNLQFQRIVFHFWKPHLYYKL